MPTVGEAQGSWLWQTGNTSALLEAMWLPLLPDCGLTHPGMGCGLALGLSQGKPSPRPMSGVSLGVLQWETILGWKGCGAGAGGPGGGISAYASSWGPVSGEPFRELFPLWLRGKITALVR